ncbi:hypothetical protein MAPG_08242 [Magnaporthiopsis poae ATCC 64411]|uniref:Uncharacterized protein n=1 Tax=Magnaporthiopsis poae (strain ATCC 64411 / 73-15) TaxID=644358 RepID=A0A0C4E6U5_MAGP6|nr:hypothetical protein MAPG_08242 [Magnaporthiopsis poae ATCC 64411]
MFQVAAPEPDRLFRSEPQPPSQRHHPVLEPPAASLPRSRSSLPPTLHGSHESHEDSIRKGLYAALAQATHKRDHGAAPAASAAAVAVAVTGVGIRPLGGAPVDQAAGLYFSFGGKPPVVTPSVTQPAASAGDIRPRIHLQKRSSASASFPSAPVEKNEALLRPPPRSLRTRTRVPAVEAAAAMSYPAAVQVMPAVQYEPYRPPNEYYPAAGHYARASDRPVEQSTEDFVMRTERSAARARAIQQQQQYWDKEPRGGAQESYEPAQQQHQQWQGHQQYHHQHQGQQEHRQQQQYPQPGFQHHQQEAYGQQHEYSHQEYSQGQYRWYSQQEPRQWEQQGRQPEYPQQEQNHVRYRPLQHEYPEHGHRPQEQQHQQSPPSEFAEQRYPRPEQSRQQLNFQGHRGPQPMPQLQEHSSRHSSPYQYHQNHQGHQHPHQPQHPQLQQNQQQQQSQQQYQQPQPQPLPQTRQQQQPTRQYQQPHPQPPPQAQQHEQQQTPPRQRDRYEPQQQQQQQQQQQNHHRQQQQQQPQASPPQPQQQQQQQQPAAVPATALQTPVSDARTMPERLPDGPPRPLVYNTPRRISSASSASASSGATTLSRDSVESRMRSPSWSSQTSVESFYSAHSGAQNPASGWTPAFGWQRPQPLKTRRKARPGELFSALPGEVLGMILDEVRKLHLAPGSISCATCWMRDACSVALSAKKWLKYARTALYEDVLLVGPDSAIHKKKYKGVIGTRLVLLRRSLRANPFLAATVRSLKVPATPPNVSEEEYQNIVATVVMACPNLERVVGFYPSYDHSYGRFFQALSTRQRLKDMVWLVQPSPFQRQQRMRRATDEQGTMVSQWNLITPGDLQPQQAIGWLESHSNWRFLTSLTIHCNPGATLAPGTLMVDTLSRLPALHTLHLSHLPHNAFGDAALLSLPSLKKISMFHLSGISSAGLSAFATRRESRSLESLTLVHIDIESLPALARALSNLTSLESLSVVQSFAPVLPADEFIWLFPYLASASLKTLHWDMTSAVSQASATDSILAKSIAADGFPSLRRLRAPADPEGLFQSLCKPREKIDLPVDRYRHSSQRPDHSRAASTASSQPSSDTNSRAGGGGFTFTPTSPHFPADAGIPTIGSPRLSSNLQQARRAAQARLEAAKQNSKFTVNVTDEDGSLVETFGLGAYVGDATSKIAYYLLPDPGALDEKGGLVDVADLVNECGEDLTGASSAAALAVEGREAPVVLSKKEKEKLQREKSKAGEEVNAREGCQGRWNTFSGAVIDKKDKERWFHTERGRWRGVTLS